MKLIRHGAAAFVIMAMVIGLFVSAYSDLTNYYSVTPGDEQYSPITNSTGNIMEQLNSLQLMQGMEKITNNILKIGSPDATSFDIVGGLASLGIGVLQTIVGIAIFPFDIGTILGAYYLGIPKIILTGVAVLFSLYLGFIILSSYLKNEV